MKTVFITLCIALFTSAAFSQKVTSQYDKFKDRTTVYSYDTRIPRAKDDRSHIPAVTMRAWFDHPGTQAAPPNAYMLEFSALAYGGWNFLTSHRLILIADGERIELGEGYRHSTYGRYAKEYLAYGVSPAQMLEITNAQSVEMQLGFFEAELSPKQRSYLAALLDAAK